MFDWKQQTVSCAEYKISAVWFVVMPMYELILLSGVKI